MRYQLSFTLTPGATAAHGSETLRFVLRDASAPLLLDFRDGTLAALAVNGRSMAIAEVNGHLRLPAWALRPGTNTVSATFDARIAVAGSAMSRVVDHEDGSEYIYTLFVPMDASMAFPCFDQPDLKGRFQLDVTAPANWTVLSNSKVKDAVPAESGQQTTAFVETPPISTYAFAFAAGPFQRCPAPKARQGCT